MKNLRADFPILQQKINNQPLVYFDSAATSHKPQRVIDAIVDFYTRYNANVGRGIHSLAEQATSSYEDARETIADFIGAQPEEIIFTRGTTEGINFVAATWAMQNIKSGDEILLTEMEHHSNLLPWQQVAQKTGALLKFIPVTDDGLLDVQKLPDLLSAKTKLVSVVHVSNALGTHNDVELIVREAQKAGAKVLIDAAQSVPHQKTDVKKLGCDFLVFSGHKILGPTGIGVLYIKSALHDKILPYQCGGGMIFSAGLQKSTFLPAPQKFEAGTPAIGQAVGLAAAIDYINKEVDFNQLKKHEAQLCTQLINGLQNINGITTLGPQDQLKKRGHLVSFTVDGIHPHDVAAYLNQYGICVRAGHHCTQPLHNKLGISASVRASFYIYNTAQEVDFLLEKLKQLVQNLSS